MNDETLQYKLDQLKAARDTRDTEKTTAADLYEALKSNPDFIAWEKAKTLAKTSDLLVDELENAVRTLALEQFNLTGEKQPHEKIQIAMHSVVKPYNEAAAREWCFTNFRPALVLDAKEFESQVKKGNVPAAIAKSDTEPRVKIATKL